MTAVQADRMRCPACKCHDIDPRSEDVCASCADRLVRRDEALQEWRRWKGYPGCGQFR